MKYCTKCGNQLSDDAMFCPNCGSVQPKNTGMSESTIYIIWSAILIVLCNPVSFILGIIALVHAAKASAMPADAQRMLNIARTLCIVATCIDGALLISGITGHIFGGLFHSIFHFGRFFWW